LRRILTGGWAAPLLLASLAVFCVDAASAAPRTPSFSLTLPSEVLQFDDGLDVRDSLGRTSSSSQAKGRLRALFVGGVYALLTRPELPRMAERLALLGRLWDLASGAVGRAAGTAWRAALSVWLPSVKKLLSVPALCLLAVLPALAASLLAPLSETPRLGSLLKSLSSTLLRC
jgi:hypothetical protein